MPYFVHLAALVLGFVPALVTLAAYGLGFATPNAIAWVYAVTYVLALYGVYVRRAHFVVRELDVPIANLAPELHGLRMAHLSDLHIGGLMQRRQAMRWIHAANAAKPDLIVLTGDYVTSGIAFHGDIAQLLGALEAPLGVYASLGNHDYFGGGEPMITLLREHGVKVLRNEGESIRRGNAGLHLAGADDVWTRRADMVKTLASWDRKEPCILLAHDPDLFVKAAEQGVHLTLSGHTHGGQIAVPFLARWLSLSHLAHRYHQGFYERGASRLYVSPGLGTTGLPLRIGTVPTIAVHVLRAR
jgi:predicted MPP superfamily phosphohydrolase